MTAVSTFLRHILWALLVLCPRISFQFELFLLNRRVVLLCLAACRNCVRIPYWRSERVYTCQSICMALSMFKQAVITL